MSRGYPGQRMKSLDGGSMQTSFVCGPSTYMSTINAPTFAAATCGDQRSHVPSFAAPSRVEEVKGAAHSSFGKPEQPARHRRISVTGGLVGVLAPWVLFTATCWFFCTVTRYTRPDLAYAVVFAGGVAVCILACMAAKASWEAQTSVISGFGDDEVSRRVASWHTFVAISAFACWILGMVVGEYIYSENMHFYYDISSMNTYAAVDPAKSTGKQLLDAGIVTFAAGTRIDRAKAAHYSQRSGLFCVAPIVPQVIRGASNNDTSSPLRLASYDFWAVGVNCCGDRYSSFRCGAYDDALATAGLRSLDEEDNKMFKLATKQAEAQYGIPARDPLFFHWREDPTLDVSRFQEAGFVHLVFSSLMIVGLLCSATALLLARETMDQTMKIVM
eukprot:TRINITY_DN67191_c0_g1_i1.p1 TRINITY_DN67191_c0_g1~~TRINITY_DN67191_c0_g1_i1.p1  ORF type:complete len:387 (-),score=75.55 TRINITY_DN67191_c0_g1_i1:97-1257(-)